MLAPPLYRLALTSFLQLKFAKNKPPTADLQGFITWRCEQSDFNEYQHIIERGVLRARRRRKK